MKRDSCIYEIVNLMTNKIYIGSAVHFAGRKGLHLFELRLNKHKNKHLQNSFNKYGEENFIFKKIEVVEDENKLLEREQYWIDLLKPEYNINPVAGSRLNSIAPNRRFTNEQVQEIIKLKEEGMKIKDIAILYNIDSSNISRMLNGRFYRDIISFNKPIKVKKYNKLPEEIVKEIFVRSKKENQNKLSKEFGVEQSIISRIHNRKNYTKWTNVL